VEKLTPISPPCVSRNVRPPKNSIAIDHQATAASNRN
jgi:hypothetical protein